MEFPIELKSAIEKKVYGMKQEQLIRVAQDLSKRYRSESGKGKRLLTNDVEALVYSIVRMPATFGAVTSALMHTLQSSSYQPKTVIDVGAGTGAGSWGANGLLELDSITCLEREDSMRRLGQDLISQGGDSTLKNTKWIKSDILTDELNETGDLIIASYVLNELSEEKRLKIIDKLWNSALGMLLIVEPGTPVGFSNINSAREYMISKGANIAAPCPHIEKCRLDENDWCHFTCRVARGKLHKMIKLGDVPYEDEKYSYIAFTKFKTDQAQSRILRHPYTLKGQISLELCGMHNNEKVVIHKKDKNLYKKARKAKCGDEF